MSGLKYKYYELKPHRLKRLLWLLINITVFRLFIPHRYSSFFKAKILRLFGAEVPSRGLNIYPSCDIYAPWNLKVGRGTTIGPNVNLYNKDLIVVGENVTISQGAHLCTGTHDYLSKTFDLIIKPIVIGDNAWVAADAFIGPGVVVGEGAVVGARACVFKDVPAWTVVGGNPAKVIKERAVSREEWEEAFREIEAKEKK